MEQQGTVKREFVIDRQGKSFVLYAGLLDLAHSQGLRAIRTHLIQVPSEDNNQVAIVAAEVDTSKGTFSGLGDASPANVSRAMLTATIRLAETRAKARALRDACNIGVAALEEMAEDEPEMHPAPRPQVALPVQRPAPQPPTGIAPPVQREPTPIQNGPKLSDKQLSAIFSLAHRRGMTDEDVEQYAVATYGCRVSELTKIQASAWISSLNG